MRMLAVAFDQHGYKRVYGVGETSEDALAQCEQAIREYRDTRPDLVLRLGYIEREDDKAGTAHGRYED